MLGRSPILLRECEERRAFPQQLEKLLDVYRYMKLLQYLDALTQEEYDAKDEPDWVLEILMCQPPRRSKHNKRPYHHGPRYCVDCGHVISCNCGVSRCNQCAGNERSRQLRAGSRFLQEHRKTRFCVDCGTVLSTTRAKRCKECNGKERARILSLYCKVTKQPEGKEPCLIQASH